ncbi:hypothetical protein N566_15360 [Streptomycetaceae bacterium MP113-05]|nr:hypothetical protein N566_15360 [Streptomycetaceae bacterium MP113-05]
MFGTTLFLVAGAVPSAVSRPLPEPTVTPARVAQKLDPGESVTVQKAVTTPAVPSRPDVVLLVDGTGSMEPSIEKVQQQLPTITSSVRDEQPDSRFAVATYGDGQVDGERVFTVTQKLTDDLVEVQQGVDALDDTRGGFSRGPAEDWINALWQVAHGADGQTVFRPGGSPVIVLLGDASSHDPSMDHTLTDAANALHNIDARIVAVDVATELGDGLNGDGLADWVDDEDRDEEEHEPDQATRLIDDVGGTLLQGIDADQVAEKIAEGLTNLPTTVGHRTTPACSPYLSVGLAPRTLQVISGNPAAFTETITVAEDAPQGATLNCTVQFTLDGTTPQGPDSPTDQGPVPAYTERISIEVNDTGEPTVTVDDRTAEATGDDGAEIEYTATATDDVDGELPVTCEPAPGARFPVGETTVTCTAIDSAGNTGTDTATFTVYAYEDPPPDEADLAVTATTVPSENYTGRETEARFAVSNAGPDTATGVVVDSQWPSVRDSEDRELSPLSTCTRSDPCTIPAGGRRTITQTATYDAPLSGSVRAKVDGTRSDPQHSDNADTARLRILEPELTISPEVGPPGTVVIARGKNFPPGIQVELTWKPGITAQASPVLAGRDGSFEAQVLVLRKDRLGPRTLRADAPLLKRLNEEFLVVARQLQPPDFAGRS